MTPATPEPTEFNVSTDGTDPRYRYTAEERDQAASAGHPFELEYGGHKYTGKAILTDDDRVVMFAEGGAVGVVPMEAEGAARMRNYLQERAADTCTAVNAAAFGSVMNRHDRIAVPGGLASPLDRRHPLLAATEGVEVPMEPGLQARADDLRAGMGNSAPMFAGEFGDAVSMPDDRGYATADGGPAPADMRTPLVDPAELLGRVVTITPIRSDLPPAELGQAFARGQRFEPLELERPVETSLAVIYDNEDIAHEVGKIYVYDGAAVIHVSEPSAVRYLQGGGAIEISRDREFAGNPYRPFVDGEGNPVSVLAELEAIASWEGSTERLEGLVARLAKAVMYSHRLLEKRSTPAGPRGDADRRGLHFDLEAGREVLRRDDGLDPTSAGLTIPDSLSAEQRVFAANGRLAAEVSRLRTADQLGPIVQQARAILQKHDPENDIDLAEWILDQLRTVLTPETLQEGDRHDAAEGLRKLADMIESPTVVGQIESAENRERRLLAGAVNRILQREGVDTGDAEAATRGCEWPERLYRHLIELAESRGAFDPRDHRAADRRGDVPGAFAQLVREAGGAGYLTHLDPKNMEMRPRELLAEALKFGSEASRDLGVLRQGRPDSSRMRVEFGTDGYAIPIDIAGEYLRADVGSPERIAVLLAGVAGVSDRVRELEEAAESAASRIEVDSESDSIDDRFAAAAEACRLLRRAL